MSSGPHPLSPSRRVLTPCPPLVESSPPVPLSLRERGNEATSSEALLLDARSSSPLSAYAERGTGGEDEFAMRRVGVMTLGRTGVLGWSGVTDVNGGNMSTTRLWRAAVAIVGLATGLCTWPLAAQGVPIGAADIAGVVTGPNGPEAGVWVIAETHHLPTKFVRIVVTDDQGRYLIPDLP